VPRLDEYREAACFPISYVSVRCSNSGFIIHSGFSKDVLAVTKLEALFIGISAVITVFYVILTYGILLESKESRDIAFISRQLEEYYLPLHRYFNYCVGVEGCVGLMDTGIFLKKFLDNQSTLKSAGDLKITTSTRELCKNLHFELSNRKYLAKSKSQETLNKLFYFIDS
jgi:hypothetical protein